MASPIRTISDTARWVAHYRALESARPDALFNDHLAGRLAGERGAAMARSVAGGPQFAWALSVRTRLIDDLITRLVTEDSLRFVVNLAAGFDTRPYRLPLPAGLRWIEVDLPALIGEKNEMLKNEQPVCRLERVAVDLADDAARRDLMTRLGAEPGPGLVLTEGLLLYLEAAQVKALGADLATVAPLRWWLTDLVSPRLLEMMTRGGRQKLGGSDITFKFATDNAERFFGELGWELTEFQGMFEAGHRLGREMRMAWLWRIMMRFMKPEAREQGRRMSGIGVLRKKD